MEAWADRAATYQRLAEAWKSWAFAREAWYFAPEENDAEQMRLWAKVEEAERTLAALGVNVSAERRAAT